MNVKSITAKVTDEGLLVTSVYSYGQPVFSQESFNKISEALESENEIQNIPKMIMRDTLTKKSYLFQIVDDVFKVSDLDMRDPAILPPSLLFASPQLFSNIEVNAVIKEFVKSSIETTVDREETYSILSKLRSELKDLTLREGICETEDTVDSTVDMVLFVSAYSFPHFLKFNGENKEAAFVFDEFYYEWMRDKDFMTQPTISRFADNAFGSKRKTFRRVAKFMNPIELYTANRLSASVSADELESAVKDFSQDKQNSLNDLSNFDTNILSNFSSTVRRNLLKSLFEAYDHTQDAFDMVSRYATDYSVFKGVKTVEDLHDAAMELIPKLTDDNYLENLDSAVRENQEIELSNESIKLNLLTNQKDFVSVGDKLKICIGSAGYFESAMDAKAYCYTISHEDTLIGAIEVEKKNNQWRSVQCRGFKNSTIDDEKMIVDSLLSSLDDPITQKELLSIGGS